MRSARASHFVQTRSQHHHPTISPTHAVQRLFKIQGIGDGLARFTFVHAHRLVNVLLDAAKEKSISIAHKINRFNMVKRALGHERISRAAAFLFHGRVLFSRLNRLARHAMNIHAAHGARVFLLHLGKDRLKYGVDLVGVLVPHAAHDEVRQVGVQILVMHNIEANSQ